MRKDISIKMHVDSTIKWSEILKYMSSLNPPHDGTLSAHINTNCDQVLCTNFIIKKQNWSK